MNISDCWQFLLLFSYLVNASDSSQTTAVISGASSGFVSGLVLQPFDVVKTRLQETKAGVSRMEILRTVYRDRGILGFWRGVGKNLFH
jgi:solute carrier family 25 protein 38